MVLGKSTADIEARMLGQIQGSDMDIVDFRLRQRKTARTSWLSSLAVSPCLYVGAASEVEMKEKKDQCRRCSCMRLVLRVEEGIVPGGGAAFVTCYSSSDCQTGR